MTPHAADSKTDWQLGLVRRVYPDTWEVDVELVYAANGTVRRAKVLGVYLPEVHTLARPSQAVVGWLDSYQQAPVAVPLHNTLAPAAERKDHVYWSEHHGFRIKIREPGHSGVLRPNDQVGELEVRSLKGGRPLQLRIIEDGGIVRIDTPTTRIVLHDDEQRVEVHADGDVVVDAGGDIAASAGGNASVNAGGNISASAGGNASVSASGSISATAGGNATVNAVGSISLAAATVNVTAGNINFNGSVNITGSLDVI